MVGSEILEGRGDKRLELRTLEDVVEALRAFEDLERLELFRLENSELPEGREMLERQRRVVAWIADRRGRVEKEATALRELMRKDGH